jgi:hypothetical protein
MPNESYPLSIIAEHRRAFGLVCSFVDGSDRVIASGFFHIRWADAAASVAFGLLLAGVAWVLVRR